MKRSTMIVLAVLFVLLLSMVPLLGLYTDWLFFAETGLRTVFYTMLQARLGGALLFGLAMLLMLAANLLPAARATFPRSGYVLDGADIQPVQLDQARTARLILPVGFVTALLLTGYAGLWGALRWNELLLFLNALLLGKADPIIGRDLGFYLFRLPLMEALQGFISFTLTVSLIMAAAIYYIKGGILLTVRGLVIDLRVRHHLALLAGLFLLALGFGFYLDGFRLLFSSEGTVYGAGYTDVTVRLNVYRMLTVLAVPAALLLVAGIWKERIKLALLGPAVLAALYGVGIKLYPQMLQKFKVAPNELALEAPYIGHNINFTRLGYNLEAIKTRPFDTDNRLSEAGITANDATIKNIRLWDHAPLLRTYSQLQQIRTYYRFFDVDNDRYTVNGKYSQIMLSPRELSYSDLPSKSWINERMIFTHGNGIAMGPVSRISKEGLPEFYVKDIPPVSLADIKVTRPEIYYGELSNDYVVVKTKVAEFSYPTATGNINTIYGGKGGVPLDSLLKKALFAIRFKTEKLLLSTDITRESKILYYRNINSRVKAIAPFLRFDVDPYMVVTDSGRLVWMIDAYTYSDRLPYSKPLKGGINYMRNSVKAVVDAYDGSVSLYISDPEDPIIKVYSKIFPTLFKPLAEMPDGLLKHVRYPHQFMEMQAAIYAAYHMTDPQVFYNKENLWEVPMLAEKRMEAYYTIMRLPEEKKEEYILLLPFTPAKRDNLAAWLTARCDAPNYGKLIAYTFPRDRLVYGPKQVDARINQDADISQQLTLWNQHGSEVIRGSMLVIPIENSLLYVQPLFLSATDKSGLPELRRVIVAFGDQVVMEDNLELALQRIFGGKRPTPSEAIKPLSVTKTGSLPELAKEAMSVYEKAISQQRQGDWSGYGESLKRLQQVLKQMNQ